jgi:uncharacterized membrane protein
MSAHGCSELYYIKGRSIGMSETIPALLGIGITGVTLPSGLTRSRTSEISEKVLKTILKIRLAKGEITKETYLDLLRLLSE